MLAVSPARNATRDDCNAASQTSCGFKNDMEDDFLDLGDHGDLLDIIDFDDLFGVAGDVLPDSEMFSDNMNASSSSEEKTREEEKRKHSKKNRSNKEGKRKVKVDWTPELHRRFVEAVEQLGVDKAVPSRILELMGVHCLTRHNVASHLQKYRSHRKHLLAREAEAANWTRKRHIYGVDAARNKNGWLAPAAPTIGFPPVHHHFSRPLHVWGHPTVEQWPKHLPSTPPFWLSDSPYWLPAIHNGTTPYLPTVATRFRAPPVAGIPQALTPRHTVYKADHGFRAARPPMDLHPSKESVDAAIGDVLTRPWLPLPLGLKPPAVDGVMTELRRHGVSEVPLSASCA